MGNTPASPPSAPAYNKIMDELKEAEQLVEQTKKINEDPESYIDTATKTIKKLIDIIETNGIPYDTSSLSPLRGKLTALSEYEYNASNTEKFSRLKGVIDPLLGKVFKEIAPMIERNSQQGWGGRAFSGGSRKSKKSHKKSKKSHKKSKKSHRKI